MRCVDVIRELAAPTGDLDPAGLAEHMTRCPGCASWAERDARLGRLWDATRPLEPSASAWEQIWANVSEALDRPPVLVPASPAPASPRRWRRAAMSAAIVAQAAAIVVGFAWLWNQTGPERPANRPLPAIAAKAPTPKIEIEQGPVVLISLDSPSIHVQTIARNDSINAVDPFYKFYNEVEGIAATP